MEGGKSKQKWEAQGKENPGRLMTYYNLQNFDENESSVKIILV